MKSDEMTRSSGRRARLVSIVALAIMGVGSYWQTALAQVWPNEPAGAALVTDWGFDALVGGGWSNNGGSAKVVADAAAPLSLPNAVDFPYPAGFPGGVGPDNIYHSLPAANQLYIGYWWKPSSPWEGHPSNVNKISFQMGVMNNLIQSMWGAGSGPFKLMNGLEFPTINNSHLGNGYGDAPGTWQLFGNVSGCGVTLGQWHRVEVYYKKSATETSRDGTLRWWLDGSLCGNYSTVNFPAGNFQEFQFAPTWGGVGSVKTESDHYWFDHVHISLPSSGTMPPVASCDANNDGSTNVVDVQLAVNQALGAAACASDINQDGSCNVVDVQRIVNAALGGACVGGL